MTDIIKLVPLHGGQLHQIAERFAIPVSQLKDFSVNINPDGPPPAVLSTLRSSLEDISVLTTYPDLEERALKRSIADYAGAAPKNLAVANGFVPLLECALRTLGVKRCLLPVPAFVEYRRSLRQLGVEVTPHILTPESDFRYDIEALALSDCDAILLANPQNPSGILTRKDVLLQLVSMCAERNVRVLLDEAFIDYAPTHSLAADAHRCANLIVFRSVTKFHGIPGLRVAYAVANEDLAQAIHRNLPPWPITTLASCAVASALGESTFAERTIRRNASRRSRLRTGLQALGIEVYPSAANFVLFRLPHRVSPDQFWTRMIVAHQIVLRDCSNYESLPPGHLRAAVRTEQEMEYLLSAFAHELSQG